MEILYPYSWREKINLAASPLRLLLGSPPCYTHPHSPHECHPMPDRRGHPGRRWCRSWMASGVSSLPWVAASLEVLRRKKGEPIPTVFPSNNSASVLSYQWLPTSMQCGEAMASRRKEDGRVGSASRGMVRRWGRFSSRVRPRYPRSREGT